MVHVAYDDLIWPLFDVNRIIRVKANGGRLVTSEQAASKILEGLKEAGINFAVSLPDVNLTDLLALIESDQTLTHVPLCREEEGIGICAGGYLAGKKCVAIMQNGGFLNSHNAIVSTLLQYEIPLLLLIYYAGDIGDRSFSTTGGLTEPLLNALRIRSYVLRDTRDANELIKRAQILAEDSRRPVAILLTKEALGRRPALNAL